MIVYDKDEMKTVIKIIFQDKYKEFASKIAQNLYEFYPENGYDWNDIVDDFAELHTGHTDECFGLDNVIETLNSGDYELIVSILKKKLYLQYYENVFQTIEITISQITFYKCLIFC